MKKTYINIELLRQRSEKVAQLLTAAQPPGTTPATRTGESPLSVRPRPPSPLCRQITCTGPQRARAQNTDRGPCSATRDILTSTSRSAALQRGSYSVYLPSCLSLHMSHQFLEDISNLDCRKVGRSDFWFLMGSSWQQKTHHHLLSYRSIDLIWDLCLHCISGASKVSSKSSSLSSSEYLSKERLCVRDSTSCRMSIFLKILHRLWTRMASSCLMTAQRRWALPAHIRQKMSVRLHCCGFGQIQSPQMLPVHGLT